MTPEELEALIAKKLFSKHLEELTWTEVASVIGANERAAIVGALQKGQGVTIGSALQAKVYEKLREDAATEAAAMMADNTLSEAELLRIFG